LETLVPIVPQILWRGRRSRRLYILQDANFNVTALVNTSGAVVERYTYDPFGHSEVRNASWVVQTGGSAYAWVYQFQGLRRETAAEYDYARNRIYSPALMRFVSTDPLGFAAGDMNLYRFVGNAPSGRLDPSGLDWQHVIPATLFDEFGIVANPNGMWNGVELPMEHHREPDGLHAKKKAKPKTPTSEK
jgi:RHS repeat-associated protein